MRALTVVPGKPDSLAVSELPDPEPGPGQLLVQGLAFGICGTDQEILRGEHGAPPPDDDRLVLGHESLGRVLQAPTNSGFTAGELVVGVVRRPDPVPCGACARGEFDMCRNGRYTERGIKQQHGYGSETWTVHQDYVVRLDPKLETQGMLLEPTTVVAKAWEQIDRVGARSWFEPHRVLITGAGTIGLLAALIGVQRGLDVHVLDQVASGPKPRLVEALGATYHHDPAEYVAAHLEPDVAIEATGVGSVIFDVMRHTAAYGIFCLTGLSPTGRTLSVDAGALNRELVMENDMVLGSVNANLRHYRQAADALAGADADWLEGLITRRVPLTRAAEAFSATEDDVKVVLTLSDQG